MTERAKTRYNLDVQSVRQINVKTDHTNDDTFLACAFVCVLTL